MVGEFDIFEGIDENGVAETVTTDPAVNVLEGIPEPNPVKDAAKTNLKLVESRDTQAEVKARKDSNETGLPVEFTRNNPTFNKVGQEAAIDDAGAGVTSLIADNTLDAAIFKGTKTIEDLNTFERLYYEDVSFGDAVKAPFLGIAAGVLKVPELAVDAFTIIQDVQKKYPYDITTTFNSGELIRENTDAIEKYSRESMFDLRAVSKDAQEWIRSKLGDTKAEELLFQSGETFGAMAASFMVGGEGGILTILSLSSGYKKTANELIAGSPKHRAFISGVLSAVTEYWTEKIPLGILTNKQLSFFERLAQGLVADVPGELIATATEMKADEIILGKSEQPLEVYIQALIDTALVATLTTVGTTSSVGALEVASKKLDADTVNSKKVADKIKVLSEQIAESNLQEELGEENVKIAMEKIVGAEAEAYIPPDGAVTLFQIDNAEQQATVNTAFEKLGIEPKEAMKLAQNGQDIILLQSDLLGLLNKEERDLIIPHIKSDFSDLSETEINENVQADNKVILDESIVEVEANELIFQLEVDRIEQDILATGVTSEQAEASTRILEQFANGLALQGQDRTAFLRQFEFRKTPFVERAFKKVKETLRQAPADIDTDLRETKTELSVRRNRLLERGFKATEPSVIDLEARITKITEQQRDRAFIDYDTLYQSQKDPRAQITFTDDKTIIELFERADASSIPHELGHAFLKELSSVSQLEEATAQLKTDMQSTLNWLGAESIETLTTEQQEQWARGFETWLREGKAPTAELDTIFARFKRWLTEVYKKATRLNIELSPEMRGVFNRMIDADNETKSAAAVHNMIEPTTDRMNELGIPDAEQRDLKLLVNKGVEKAGNAKFRAVQRAVRENSAKFRKESEQEVREENPVYDTMDLIIKEGNQIDRDSFIGYYTVEGLKQLPNQRIIKKNGLQIETVAALYEFNDVFDMVDQLFNTPKFQDAVNQRVAQKTETLEATFKSEDYLAETKEYADFIQRWNDHLRNEQTRAVRAGETGQPRKKITTEQMKAYAQDQINELSVREAQRTDKFLNAMKRAAVAMRKAEGNKDWAKAIRESEKMLLNKEMAAISVRNKRAVTSFVNRAKKFRKLGAPQSVSLQFREAVRSLIERFSILPNIAPQKPVTNEAIHKLLKGDEHTGEFFVSEGLITNDIRDFKNLSMLELTELDNMIKFLTLQGRQEQQGIIFDGQAQLDEVVEDNVVEMEAIKPIKVHDRFSIARKTTDISRKFFGNLLGLPYITKALGGYKALKGQISSLETWITEKLKDIEDVRLRRYDTIRQRIQVYADVITNAQRRMIKDVKGQKLFDSGVPVPEVLQDNGSQLNYWTPEQIMSLAFNRGNESNINALLEGFPGLNLAQVDQLLNKYLTEQDMDAVQGILDEMEKLFKETDATHVKMKGYHINKVPAQTWTFKGKSYRGGYYPLNYDRILSDWLADQKQVAEWFDSEEAKFTVPYAAFTHTMTRKTGHKLPVDLRLIGIYRHFDKSIRYITHAETIRDIDRITKDSRFKAAAEKALGKDVYKQINSSLKHIANPNIPGVDVPGKRAIGYLRSVATAANLAINTMVAMKQVFSTPSAIHDMGLGDGGGFKAYIKGMGIVLASPAVAYNTMLEMSSYMKQRITSWERDLLRPKFNKMTPAQREVAFGNRHVTWDDVVNLGFFEIKAMDTATVLPIWWGAYQDKLNENSSNEAEAIRHADNIVRDTQPSATALDLSAWFREGGFFSLFNLHQTFTVGKYGQRQRTYLRAFRDGKISAKEYAWFNFMDAFIPLISINIMVAFLKGGDLAGDEDEWWTIAERAASSWVTMGIPVAGSLYDAVTKGWRDPLEVPGARQVKRTARTLGHLGQGTSSIITDESLTQKEKQELFIGMADMVSDFARFPMSKVMKKALEGDGFREKIFGKSFKKKKKR